MTPEERFELDSKIEEINQNTEDAILVRYDSNKQRTLTIQLLEEVYKAINEIKEKTGIEITSIDYELVRQGLEMGTFIKSELKKNRLLKEKLLK